MVVLHYLLLFTVHSQLCWWATQKLEKLHMHATRTKVTPLCAWIMTIITVQLLQQQSPNFLQAW